MSKKFTYEQFCSNNADPITLEDFEDGQDLVIINISSEKGQCYLRSSLCEFWKNNEDYYRLPLGGYVDRLSKVMICTSKYTCFGLIKRETKTIKGEKTKVYLLRPIDENQFLNENKIQFVQNPIYEEEKQDEEKKVFVDREYIDHPNFSEDEYDDYRDFPEERPYYDEDIIEGMDSVYDNQLDEIIKYTPVEKQNFNFFRNLILKNGTAIKFMLNEDIRNRLSQGERATLYELSLFYNHRALDYFPREKFTPDFNEYIVSKAGGSLKYIPEDLRTKELCLIALQQNCYTSNQFVPLKFRRLKAFKEIMDKCKEKKIRKKKNEK